MAGRTIGLDVGTHAVRAAEISFGRGRPRLDRFGQVTLPPGAVVNGEVVDASLVSAAIRRLWREAGFRSKQVVVGIANQRVVTRTAVIPAMPEAELRSALRFQVQDLIPIPLDEAELDFQVVEHLSNAEGQPMLRILVVAAHREVVGALLESVTGAGLTPTRVDLGSFALLRSLDDGTAATAEAGVLGEADGSTQAEAVVDVGAGVTDVVVHEGGAPRFVRTLNSGTGEAVRAVAAALEIDLDQAESLSRRADTLSADPMVARAGQVIAGELSPLIEQIRGSVEYFLAQTEGTRLARVVLVGGGATLDDIEARLAGALRAPVVWGDPLAGVDIGDLGLPAETVAASAHLLAVAVGLALSGQPVEAGLRRISLLPGHIASRQAERKQLVTAGLGVFGFAVFLLILLLLRSGQVADARAEADGEQERTAQLERDAADLQEVSGLQAEVTGRQATVQAALAGDIAWTRLFNEIATVIPNDVWLTTFQGTNDDAGSTIVVNAKGFDQTSAARWLQRAGDLPSITNLWLGSSVRSTTGTQDTVDFSSTASLTEAARSERLDDFLRGTP